MKAENLKALEGLARTCRNGGYLPIFLGVLVGFVGFINRDTLVMAVGLFMFIISYALVKIADKLNRIVSDESASGRKDEPPKQEPGK